ncbi:transferase/triacylglycerol lipase [Trypanosoma rangeli]|uniref:Transferase/triacylglycerol lipase n=1 Tax=Trypanosoma rangeli TaxID=5698 RepID=A0A3R7LQ57_TRYRA|nr:transferase/triacylglycerol lipase [Trypanosoma rangeli]RNF01268.1 transferase/triacylglycerol lipase [Trypanosoma rangeli]|eukprot:RNF01268.1 transferase/triacylglycerol lipase [Trypanosoma rangeli]
MSMDAAQIQACTMDPATHGIARQNKRAAAGVKVRSTNSLSRRKNAKGSSRPKKDLHCPQRGVKRTRLKIIFDFLYFFIVECIILKPLHVIQAWVEDYTSRAQRARTERRFINIMNSTESLDTWLTNATYLDNHRGIQAWKNTVPNKGDCDAEGLNQDAYCAKILASSENERAMCEFLRTQLHRTAHGMTNPSNFRYYTGTITCVEEYNEAVVNLIRAFGREHSYNKSPLSRFTSSEERRRCSFEESHLLTPNSTTATFANEFAGADEIVDFAPSGESDAERRADDPTCNYLESRAVPSLYLSSLLNWAMKPHAFAETHLTDIQKLEVLQDTLQSYGRSALMLSGGSTLGVSHTGVVRALFDAGLLPDIISGSSAGSLIAAIICSMKTDQLSELLTDSVSTVQKLQFSPFDHGELFTKLKQLLRTGAFMEVRTLMECLRSNLGDLTFEEAYRSTGRILNVCVTSEQYSGSHMDRHMLLNYMTSPNVVLWSAVSASCALPGLFTAVQLIEKLPDGTFRRFLPGQLWCDGSLARDLPRESLASLFNVNYFIVSQVNPHIIPFQQKPVSPLVYKERRPRKILSSLWYGCCREIHRWILKLFSVGLLSSTGRWGLLYLFLAQRYDGDILILPIGNVMHAVPDYFNIMANPTSEYIAFVTSRAQLRTWPHLNQIRHSTMIERALTRELGLLRERIRDHNKTFS